MSQVISHRSIRFVIAGLVAAFAAAQAVRPPKTNPPMETANRLSAQYETPAAVSSVLERACIDCHSYRTRWPWYSHVAPVSWLLAAHVRNGRRHMNIDDFNEEMSVKDICQELRAGTMPLQGYVLLHPEAKLTGAEIQTVCAWSRNARMK